MKNNNRKGAGLRNKVISISQRGARFLTGAALIGSVFLFESAFAFSVPNSDAVPGGVVVVPLNLHENQAPLAYYQTKRLRVEKDSKGQWVAMVGIPLAIQPGRH